MGCNADLTEYPDIYGNKTIGYGHLDKAGHYSKGIDEPTARAILESDIKNAAPFVNGHLHQSVTQNEFDSLVDTAFNSPRAAGILIRDINRGISPDLTNFVSTLPHGYDSPGGLLNRRMDEGILFGYGSYATTNWLGKGGFLHW